METSSAEWVKFFKESGLPNSAATKYAVIFSNHRIQFNMLQDLTKEILYDMGIKTMGDVIAILRHAKDVYEETTKANILGKHIDSVKKSQNNDESHSLTTAANEVSAKRHLDESEMLPRTKIRKIVPPKDSIDSNGYEYMSQGSTYVIRMPGIVPKSEKQLGSSSGNSVFKRLGAQESTSSNSSVFSRLGAATSSTSAQNKNRIVASLGSKTTTSILRGAEGASSSRIFSGTTPVKATATVKPTNVLVRKSLAEATGQSSTVKRTLPSSQRILTTTKQSNLG
ncbi:uncharacterized protein B4U79_16237 [Dinothrombium tinctorium]|uniref:SAM domain-containing protein n=1 Tax=Dinothrombium tinctorium TaxID=1965070 RepID=A0A3S3NL02_9ACAR|nr:uncharacterized protein B4U79_16382 [Dinothrombium tinctorium]RWS04792.1 uncharacterized protein B4U79_16380 [Dinothrombium tinctorium]RWS06068.1 uncharacterized protein B4U79_16247 [Dinothrombium tinctorium]RWS06219.1 uncharacterized protein B4U79_16237 [Dinothrombium tinctorium]